jgi:hypothetical protein
VLDVGVLEAWEDECMRQQMYKPAVLGVSRTSFQRRACDVPWHGFESHLVLALAMCYLVLQYMAL